MVWRDRRNTFATSAWTSRAHAAQKHWKNAEKSEVTINWWYGKTDMKTRPYRAMGPKTRSFPIFRSGGWLGCRIFVSFQAKHPNISWITAVGIWCCIVGLTKNLWLLSLVSLDGPGCLACVSSNPQPPRTIFPKQKKTNTAEKRPAKQHRGVKETYGSFDSACVEILLQEIFEPQRSTFVDRRTYTHRSRCNGNVGTLPSSKSKWTWYQGRGPMVFGFGLWQFYHQLRVCRRTLPRLQGEIRGGQEWWNILSFSEHLWWTWPIIVHIIRLAPLVWFFPLADVCQQKNIARIYAPIPTTNAAACLILERAAKGRGRQAWVHCICFFFWSWWSTWFRQGILPF